MKLTSTINHGLVCGPVQGRASLLDIYRAQTLGELKDDLLKPTFDLLSVF